MRHARINYLGELPDGSGRLAVPDLNGKLYLVEDGGSPAASTSTSPPPFAPAFFSGRGLGQGFGFVTFHPDFAQRPLLHRAHRTGAPLTTAVPDYRPQAGHASTTASSPSGPPTDPAADTFSGTRREILRIGFAAPIHGIQQIDFNPTAGRHDRDYGLLYLAVGDGGQGVSNTEPQNLALPHGKILRIDPRGTNSANGQYGIPADEPVRRPGRRARRDLRVRHARPAPVQLGPGGSHRMFLGHIGEHAHRGGLRRARRATTSAGASARARSSSTRRPPTPATDLPAARGRRAVRLHLPGRRLRPRPARRLELHLRRRRAVVGGFVYRGHDLPALRGKYVFGDLVDGRLFYTEAKRDAARRRATGAASTS